MKWNDLFSNGEGTSNNDDIKKYKEALKYYASESSRLSKLYTSKRDAFKKDIFNNFQMILSAKGFGINVSSPTDVIGKIPTITIRLWQENVLDDCLTLNIIESSGNNLRFVVQIDSNNPSIKNLEQPLGWYVNDRGELATYNRVEESVSFYREEIKRAETLVDGKRVLAEYINSLSFSIALYQNGKIVGNFATFGEALDKAVVLS